ncbi:hypothetical protein AC1031_016596 [Aphanomyces cochlioides]|nr:hypothetical protein AC1031_016596 [Aphanomyces cochlioides]
MLNAFDLWPALRLTPSILDSPYRSSYGGIAKYCGKIIVEDLWEELAWLKKYLNPTSMIEWEVNTVPSQITDEWFDLRISRLSVRLGIEMLLCWKKVLPQLTLLLTLDVVVVGKAIGLEDVFEFVTRSLRITDLKVVAPEYNTKANDLLNLTQWFRRQPVQKFECVLTDWYEIDTVVRQEFYRAMINCPTLDRLNLSNCYLDDMDFAPLNFTMKSLELVYCLVSPTKVESLANRLAGSNVTSLELSGYEDENTHGLECLVQVLPRTSIKHLKLTALDIEDNPRWCSLAQHFGNCTLNTLTIQSKQIPSAFAQSLAVAIQNNQTICELNLS